MITNRLLYAKKYLDDAMELFREERYNSAVSRLYYASYQAMWAAVGNPPDGYWKPLAIIRQFFQTCGSDSDTPESQEKKQRAVRKLYSHRMRSDYEAEEIEKKDVEPLLDIIEELIDIIDITDRKG